MSRVRLDRDDRADPARAAARRSRRSTTSSRQTHVNQRLIADLRTWRAYTGHDYHNLSIEQAAATANTPSARSSAATPRPDRPKERIQICLVIWGPDRRRPAHGARRLVPAAEHRRRPAPPPLRLLRRGRVRQLPDRAEAAAERRLRERRRVSAARTASPTRTAPTAGRLARSRALARVVAAGRADAARGRAAPVARSACRASGTTRRSRPCTSCTRASARRCARSSTPRTRRRCGT